MKPTCDGSSSRFLHSPNKLQWPWLIAMFLSVQGLQPPTARAQTIVPAWSFAGSQPGAHLGHSVGSAGDVNGDGYDDVLVGAPGIGNGEGTAYLFLGSSAGLAFSPAWQQEGGQLHAHFGFSVASAGDVNGDGYGDVLVGAPGGDGDLEHQGAVFLYLGSSAGLSIAPSRVWQGDQVACRFGASVNRAG